MDVLLPQARAVIQLVRRLLGLDLGGAQRRRPSSPARVTYGASSTVCYCIGDVHGCLQLLKELEARIVADGAAFEGPKWIVLLGDFIDRGPNSASLIDHLLAAPPTGFTRLCLAGNHERGMLEFLDKPDRRSWWLEHGGLETLASYDVDTSRITDGRSSQTERRYLATSHVPDEHVEFLEQLPVLIETPDWIFVHAGLEPGLPIERQSDETLVWYRDDFTPAFDEWGKLVVHGHTPLDDVFLSASRIDVDTGACLTGRLSAVRLVPGATPIVLEVSGPVA